MTSKEFKEFKESMQIELNSDEYPFVVKIRGDKVVASWKAQQDSEDADSKPLDSFSVTYVLRKNRTFLGGETLVHRDTYTPPMSTQTRTVFSLSTPTTLRWRKRIAPKDWANIGSDEDKLLSIIEHYLTDHDFEYHPGIWNHARLSWEEGYLFRIAGAVFFIVGIFLLIGFLTSSMISDLSKSGSLFAAAVILLLVAVLLPLISIVIGALMLLIGFGKMEFYDLRPDVGIKVVLSIIVISWLLVFLFILNAPYASLSFFAA